MKSALLLRPRGLHVAIIMDGNGRWATARGRPRTYGHRAGADAVRRVVEAAPDAGVRTLSLYAFSADNWLRPVSEVRTLMRLFAAHLRSERPRLVEQGVKLRIVGRRDRLSPALRHAIDVAEDATCEGKVLNLRVAIDYSARDAIVSAATAAGSKPVADRPTFAELIGRATHNDGPSEDVDLLIRTGGEQRLSDFMLWECAYAELYFTQVMWPDFGANDLQRAVQEFGARERRFGRLPQAEAV